jgi:hypothetical protein
MARSVVNPESKRLMPLTALSYELIEHSGEHYGQLVVYYRSAGLVPSESASQQIGGAVYYFDMTPLPPLYPSSRISSLAGNSFQSLERTRLRGKV